MSKKPHIYIIAGEASGDLLGGKLLAALKEQGSVRISGVGGPMMKKQGLKSLFPMSDLALMGFAEILPHIPKLRRRIREVVADILDKKPDVVVTIDSPGFNFRVAKKLQGASIPLVHYVAPSVWAYKPKRAQKLAALYDHLLMLLPFEQPYFEKLDIKAHFVGHPIVEDCFISDEGKNFRKKYGIAADEKLLCVLPGSRRTEVERLLPIFTEALNMFVHHYKEPVSVVIPAVPWLEEGIEWYMGEFCRAKTILINPEKERMGAYAAADIGLVKSGTGALELSLAKVPLVVAYKVNIVSYAFIKSLIRIPFVNLINISRKKQVIPELIQFQCTGERLGEELLALAKDSKKAHQQLAETEEVFHSWGLKKRKSPSQKAANLVLQVVSENNAKKY
jgi:lipid-A-disaccharide synthase